MHQTLSNYSLLKFFGCLVYAASLKYGRNKFDPRSRKYVFLGYQQGAKGDVLFDLISRKLFISRDIYIYEKYLSISRTSS